MTVESLSNISLGVLWGVDVEPVGLLNISIKYAEIIILNTI